MKRKQAKKYKPLIAFMLLISIVISIFIIPRSSDKEEKIPFKEEKTIDQLSYQFIKVPNICQYPSLPTGCETVAATMVLQYYKSNITPEEFANNWLEYNQSFWSDGKIDYGPDPNEVFAGNPFSESSYGCYATPIVKAINNNSKEFVAEKISAASLTELCKEYIDKNKPLLIWATMGMKQPKKGRSWILENGNTFTWIAGEHCLVLVGYNRDYYFLNDPQFGITKAYPKNIVEKRFKELGSQAVYIEKTNGIKTD